MGKINREELFKILDEQHERCKSNLAEIMDDNIQKLHNYHGDVIDIKTEIILGQDLEHSLFRLVDEDYYDKQKLLSVPKGVEAMKHLDGEKLWSIDETIDTKVFNRSVTAPKQHKKKYLIKLNNKYLPEELEDIGKIINENQIFVYNNDVIEQIITLDVE
jgi:hypothetical protein